MNEQIIGYISPETGETAWVQRRNKRCTHAGPCPPIYQAARAIERPSPFEVLGAVAFVLALSALLIVLMFGTTAVLWMVAS